MHVNLTYLSGKEDMRKVIFYRLHAISSHHCRSYQLQPLIHSQNFYSHP